MFDPARLIRNPWQLAVFPLVLAMFGLMVTFCNEPYRPEPRVAADQVVADYLRALQAGDVERALTHVRPGERRAIKVDAAPGKTGLGVEVGLAGMRDARFTLGAVSRDGDEWATVPVTLTVGEAHHELAFTLRSHMGAWQISPTHSAMGRLARLGDATR